MTAAELLRSLDKAATAGPWWASAVVDPCTVRTAGENRAVARCYVRDRESEDGPVASPTTVDANCIATTRNLLPELAALVEAVGAWATMGRDDALVIEALNALNAKAAEVGK